MISLNMVFPNSEDGSFATDALGVAEHANLRVTVGADSVTLATRAEHELPMGSIGVRHDARVERKGLSGFYVVHAFSIPEGTDRIKP